MDNKTWKSKNKPASCTKSPIEYLIPFEERPDTLRQIRNECLEIYGEPINDECPKRKICIGKSCLGRPLAWDSPTAKPYLEKLKQTQDIRNGELFIKTDCSGCPIFKDCKSPCYQINDFIQRDKVEEPHLQYSKDEVLDIASEVSEGIEASSVQPATLMLSNDNIPWDVLSERKRKIVEKYLYDQLDFKYIADQLGIINQAKCKYEFYLALNKLAEYGVIRKFFSENKDLLTENQQMLFIDVYYNNKSYTSVANKLNISKQAVQQSIDRVIKQHRLKWPKFVRKVKNKVIYNVPELFK